MSLPRQTSGRNHGGRRPSSDDSFHSPTVIPPSALDKPSIMNRYHRRRTTRWSVTALSPTMVTLHDTGFVECRWWNDGWTVKTVVTWRSSASMILAPEDTDNVARFREGSGRSLCCKRHARTSCTVQRSSRTAQTTEHKQYYCPRFVADLTSSWILRLEQRSSARFCHVRLSWDISNCSHGNPVCDGITSLIVPMETRLPWGISNCSHGNPSAFGWSL